MPGSHGFVGNPGHQGPPGPQGPQSEVQDDLEVHQDLKVILDKTENQVLKDQRVKLDFLVKKENLEMMYKYNVTVKDQKERREKKE